MPDVALAWAQALDIYYLQDSKVDPVLGRRRVYATELGIPNMVPARTLAEPFSFWPCIVTVAKDLDGASAGCLCRGRQDDVHTYRTDPTA